VFVSLFRIAYLDETRKIASLSGPGCLNFSLHTRNADNRRLAQNARLGGHTKKSKNVYERTAAFVRDTSKEREREREREIKKMTS
jgi:hypothetical protein